MTATLVAKDLAGGHDHRTLFSSLNLVVAPGDVVGVVGANGAGKSTLLRLLAGIDEPLEGSVSLAPADAFIGWLPQEHERVAGETVAEYVGRRTGTTEATREMDAAAEALAEEAKPGALTLARSTRSPSSAGSRAAPPTSRNVSPQCWPSSASS